MAVGTLGINLCLPPDEAQMTDIDSQVSIVALAAELVADTPVGSKFNPQTLWMNP